MNNFSSNKFKRRISLKLFIYFAVSLILFSILIGSVFMHFFREYSMDLYKTQLSSRAISIASTYGSFVFVEETSNQGSQQGRHHGQGMYTRFINNITMDDVWIVDANLNIFVGGSRGFNQFVKSDLPDDAIEVVELVFLGQTTFSEGFSDLLQVATLTVGTPIYDDNQIVGAILIHSPVQGIQEGILRGFYILIISICLALILAFLVSGVMALNFTRPLHKMNKTAILLSKKDYSAKTGVKRKDEIGQLAYSIDQLSNILGESEKESENLEIMRRDFISNISHELRTPVTVIRGSLEALVDEIFSDPQKVKSYHEQMLKESIFLERLINDLMDLSKLQNPGFKIVNEQVNINDVLKDTARSAKQLADKKHIEINLIINSQNISISGDYGRLKQMLMIVLDNAIKFSEENSEIKIVADNGYIEITDQGPGIPEDDLPLIFDRFYKSKSKSETAGTGLGLAIAKEISIRHNIDLKAKNSPTGGATFKFSWWVK